MSVDCNGESRARLPRYTPFRMTFFLLSPTYTYMINYGLLSLMAVKALTVGPKPHRAAIMFMLHLGRSRLGMA